MPKLYLKLELHIDYFTKSKHQATGEALAGWREVGQQESMMTGHYAGQAQVRGMQSVIAGWPACLYTMVQRGDNVELFSYFFMI